MDPKKAKYYCKLCGGYGETEINKKVMIDEIWIETNVFI